MTRCNDPTAKSDPGTRPCWPGLTTRRTLILPVPSGEWALPPGERVIDGVAFLPQAALHITLANRDAIAAVEGARGQARAEATLLDAFVACDWRYRRTGHFRRLCQAQLPEPDAGSIIEMLDLPGLGEFYRALAAVGMARPVPPAHLTLWTHARPRGIGVPDAATLAELHVRDVSAQELGL